MKLDHPITGLTMFTAARQVKREARRSGGLTVELYFLRMPFGLKTAVPIIGRYLDNLLALITTMREQFATCGARDAPIYKGGEDVLPFQVQDDQERLIAAARRRTTSGETNYPRSWKGEMAAMIWTEYLPGFECKTQHIAGRKNVVADGISRTPEHLDDPTT